MKKLSLDGENSQRYRQLRIEMFQNGKLEVAITRGNTMRTYRGISDGTMMRLNKISLYFGLHKSVHICPTSLSVWCSNG